MRQPKALIALDLDDRRLGSSSWSTNPKCRLTLDLGTRQKGFLYVQSTEALYEVLR